jgi:hypothetical protein
MHGANNIKSSVQGVAEADICSDSQLIPRLMTFHDVYVTALTVISLRVF